MAISKLLFLALGEEEVHAYRYMATIFRDSGYECKVITWLPRLAGNGVDSLYLDAEARPDDRTLPRIAEDIDVSFAGQVSDYDRDWHFATATEKARHAERVLRSADRTLDMWKPDVIISAVGGETLRIAFDKLAVSKDIPTLYFNAIPLPDRFVLLRSLSSGFVPLPGEVAFKPTGGSESDKIDAARELPGYSDDKRLEGLRRTWSALVTDRGVYPPRWISRRVKRRLDEVVLTRIPARAAIPRDGEVNVLYPMHDERDFQVAVRERHAVPQEHLLKYIASTLPPGYRLWVKPHPEHAPTHHTRVLKEISDVENISFMPAGMTFEDAINKVDVVLTLASTLGFEALKRGVPVVCYGSPFYSGRGLSRDVKDPRLISSAVVEAVGTVPDPVGVSELLEQMSEVSWPGTFTPIRLTTENVLKLTGGLADVLSSL